MNKSNRETVNTFEISCLLRKIGKRLIYQAQSCEV